MGDRPESNGSLIPPRPNLGPEPWGDELASWPATTVGAVLVLAVLALAWAWARAHRRRRSLDRSSETAVVSESIDPWVEASDAARAVLIRAFGPSWQSKTTEEIAADPELRERLGPDRADDLVALFLRADRVKFAAEESAMDQQQGREAAAQVLAALKAIDGSGTTRHDPAGNRKRPHFG